MNMKISSLVDYVSHLLKKYGEIQQGQMKNTFRVASIKSTATGCRIVFQVIGKSTFMECSPNEILSNDAFLERFSKKDIQQITYAYLNNEKEHIRKTPANKTQVVEQTFDRDEGQMKITLQTSNGTTSQKTASEIALDKKLIGSLTQQDALKIGYIAGYEHSQNDTVE